MKTGLYDRQCHQIWLDALLILLGFKSVFSLEKTYKILTKTKILLRRLFSFSFTLYISKFVIGETQQPRIIYFCNTCYNLFVFIQKLQQRVVQKNDDHVYNQTTPLWGATK